MSKLEKPHEVCVGCIWNKFPICNGTKMPDGSLMNIEYLKKGFICGQKDMIEFTDHSIIYKNPEILKIEELEERIKELEEVKL